MIRANSSDHLDANGESPGPDPNQLIDTFVAPPKTDRQYIVGNKPGPYVAEHSFNIYSRLGARIALVGIDARTEVGIPETPIYDVFADREQNSVLDTKSTILRPTASFSTGYGAS